MYGLVEFRLVAVLRHARLGAGHHGKYALTGYLFADSESLYLARLFIKPELAEQRIGIAEEKERQIMMNIMLEFVLGAVPVCIVGFVQIKVYDAVIARPGQFPEILYECFGAAYVSDARYSFCLIRLNSYARPALSDKIISPPSRIRVTRSR